MPSRQLLQQEDNFFRIMNTLRGGAGVSQRALAHQLGLSLGGLNYCLKAIVARGWVIVDVGQQEKKKRPDYLLTPAGREAMRTMGRRFFQRKLLELQALQAEIDALRADYAEGREA